MPTPLSNRHITTISFDHILVGMNLVLFSTRKGGHSYGFDLTYPSSPQPSGAGKYIVKRTKGPFPTWEQAILIALELAYKIRK